MEIELPVHIIYKKLEVHQNEIIQLFNDLFKVNREYKTKLINMLARIIGQLKYSLLNLSREEKRRIEVMIKTSEFFPEVTFSTLMQAFPDLDNIIKSKLMDYYKDICFASCLFLCVNSVQKANITNIEKVIKGLFIKIALNKTKTNINTIDLLFELRKFVDSRINNSDLETSIGTWIHYKLRDHKLANDSLQEITNQAKYAKEIGTSIANEFFDAWDKS